MSFVCVSVVSDEQVEGIRSALVQLPLFHGHISVPVLVLGCCGVPSCHKRARSWCGRVSLRLSPCIHIGCLGVRSRRLACHCASLQQFLLLFPQLRTAQFVFGIPKRAICIVSIVQHVRRSADGSWSSDRSMSLLTGVFGVIFRRRPVRGVIDGTALY